MAGSQLGPCQVIRCLGVLLRRKWYKVTDGSVNGAGSTLWFVGVRYMTP